MSPVFPARVGGAHFEVFLVQVGAGAHFDGEAEFGFQVREAALFGAEQLCSYAVVQGGGQRAAAQARRNAANLAQHFVGHALVREQVALAAAVSAGFAQRLHQVLAGALARHFHQAQLGNLQDVGAGLVAAHGILQRAVHLFAVFGAVHVYQVNDDKPADVANAKLVHHFAHGFQVGAQHGLFQAALAHIAAGVHINGGQRLALVHHQRAAAGQRHFALNAGVQNGLCAEVIEDGLGALVQHQPGPGLGHEALGKALHFCVHIGGIHGDAFGFAVGKVAQHAQRQRGLFVKDGRRAHAVFGNLNIVPNAGEILDIRFQVGLAHIAPGGADDEAEILRAQPVHRFAQPLALAAFADAPRNADALRPRREHQVPPGNGDVRGDARALAADGLFGDLHHDLLPLFQQALNGGGVAPAAPPGTGAIVAAFECLDVLHIVAGVEKGGLFQPHIHKGGLHARQHPQHPALHHRAGHAALARPVQVEFDELLLFEHRHPGLARRGVDEDLVLHSRPVRAGQIREIKRVCRSIGPDR